MTTLTNTINFDDFLKVDIRVGRIISVQDFPEARKASYRIEVDLGPEIGIKKSCAQLPQNYKIEELLGTPVMCVVNFPSKQIGPAQSEALILGVPDSSGNAVLLSPRAEVALGGRVF